MSGIKSVKVALESGNLLGKVMLQMPSRQNGMRPTVLKDIPAGELTLRMIINPHYKGAAPAGSSNGTAVTLEVDQCVCGTVPSKVTHILVATAPARN